MPISHAVMPLQFTIQQGVISPAKQIYSPNFNARPKPSDIHLIVIHNISLPPSQFGGGYIEDLFLNRLDWNAHPYFKSIEGMEVSAHVVILRDGSLIQCVNFNDRAWHAGVSCYLGVGQCNDYSIGIELEGTDDLPFTTEQYTTLTGVVNAIQQAYPLTQRHLAGHSDIAPQRKTDPGIHFDWQRLRESLDPV